MRVAALYDIHGNIHALDALLPEVTAAGVDVIVIGGDVATGPFPVETIERLMDLPRQSFFVMGNADRELLESTDPVPGEEPDEWTVASRWCAGRLSSPQRAFIEGFQPTVELDVGAMGPVLFCHGSPRSDEEIITPASPEARVAPMLDGVSAATVVCGHTHIQFDRSVAGKRVINAGSVGMPYADEPGAYWALLGDDAELRHTRYDLEAAAAAIRGTRWPLAKEFADENVVTVPTAATAIETFEARAGE